MAAAEEPPKTGECDMGMYGLAIMGQNFALNMASKGFKIAVCNRSPAKVDTTVARAKAEGPFNVEGYKDVKEFVLAHKKPRKIMMLVMAGKPVDDTIALLAEHMEAGDVLVDGGNEWFPNSERRAKELAPKGIHFVGMGVSGGEEGARNGPSLMPGGPKEAYDLLEPIITKCAAQVDDGPCTFNCGPIGAGNYVKMVHNGIEYGDMQLIAEVYDILKTAGGFENGQLCTAFNEWNKTELESYLIEITGIILGKEDDLTGEGFLVDKILDKTGMKGTGRWTVQEGAERSVPVSTMTAALDTRYLSARKTEREAAAVKLLGPVDIPGVDKGQMLEDCKSALYAAKICSYAQGMNLIKAMSVEKGWGIDLAECARIWKGGCIIRAAMLDRIRAAYVKDPELASLLVDGAFAEELNSRHLAWRRIVTLGVACGVPCPALSASLAYLDTYRRARLPANLTQAQRDFFGGHSYKRTDREGDFHTQWTDDHKEIGDLAQRTEGNV